ncbi:hypothetical protein GS534_00960 [Rhodococcus hoagii]|nr:hypothetical protein [Prescottella equi]
MPDFVAGLLLLPCMLFLLGCLWLFGLWVFDWTERMWEEHAATFRREPWHVHSALAAWVARSRRAYSIRIFGWLFIVTQTTPAVIRGGEEKDGSDEEGIRLRRISAAISEANTNYNTELREAGEK